MKSVLLLLCAATLGGASFAAQSAPAGDQQRIVAELLQMAQQRNAAGDIEMARALTEQASRMMGGQAGAAAATERIQTLQALGYAEEPVIQEAWIQEYSALEPELARVERSRTLAAAELAQLGALGYANTTQAPAQDDLHASLRQIRHELQALRAEVSALRAEIAGQRSRDPFQGGMAWPSGPGVAPGGPGAAPSGMYHLHGPTQGTPQGGYFHAPAPNAQPEFYYFQGGAAPGAPGSGQAAPSGSWEWRQSGPGQHPGAPPQAAPPGGGSGAWQRHQAEAEAQAAAAGHERHAAAQEAHAAARTAPPPAPPAPPLPPATPSTPRTAERSGGGSRPHNLF